MRACMYVCQCMYVMYVCVYVMYARCMLCAGGPSGQRVWTFYMCRKLVSRCCMLQAMSRFARRSRSMLTLVSRNSLFCQTCFSTQRWLITSKSLADSPIGNEGAREPKSTVFMRTGKKQLKRMICNISYGGYNEKNWKALLYDRSLQQ